MALISVQQDENNIKSDFPADILPYSGPNPSDFCI